MKRKNILCLLLLTALLLSACGNTETAETTAAATTAEPTVVEAELALSSFSLSTTAWSSPNGVTVNLTAVPSTYEEGQTAAFIVHLGENEEANVACEWNGTEYTASADLNAADGYSYYVLLTSAAGQQEEAAINTPEKMVYENLVNLATALDAYCTVTIEGTEYEEGTLTVTSGMALVQVPQISEDGEAITCADAALILSKGDQELSRANLTMTATEVEGSFEQALTDVTFDIPALAEGDQLELRMEATLSNGQFLTTPAGTWLYNGETLESSVG